MVKIYFLIKKKKENKLKKLLLLNIQETIESLILAQDERWRYALHMQVVREFFNFSGGRVSNT